MRCRRTRSCFAPRGRKRHLGGPAYREDLAHIRGKHCAIVSGKAGQWTSLVPGDRQRFAQRAASICEASDSQLIAAALELGGNNRHTVSRFREAQQGVRVSTFKLDCRPQSRHPAGRVEGTAKSEAAVHQKQRKTGEARNLDGAAVTKRHRGMANCQQLHRSQRKAAIMALVQLDGMQQVLTEVDLSAFEQRQYLAPGSLADLHLDLRIALRVTMQELRQHALNMLRRAGDL